MTPEHFFPVSLHHFITLFCFVSSSRSPPSSCFSGFRNLAFHNACFRTAQKRNSVPLPHFQGRLISFFIPPLFAACTFCACVFISRLPFFSVFFVSYLILPPNVGKANVCGFFYRRFYCFLRRSRVEPRFLRDMELENVEES